MEVQSLLSPAQLAVRDRLASRDRDERNRGVRDEHSLLAVAPPVAEFLYVLALHRCAKVLVELGTSHGYSTLHLAAAAARTGGRVYSIDQSTRKTEWARANLAEAGLLEHVELLTGEGAERVPELPPGIDLILIDYGVEKLDPTYALLEPKLAAGALLFVDGGPPGYWESGAARAFKQRLAAAPDWLVSMLPMHKEQLLALRLP